MSYIKHNFETGDILYASDLNEMDDQIATNEESVSDVKNEIAIPDLAAFANKNTATSGGVTYSYDGNFVWNVSTATFSGTPSYNLFLEQTFSRFKAGQKLYFDFHSTSPASFIQIYKYVGATLTYLGGGVVGWYTIPLDATGILIRVRTSEAMTGKFTFHLYEESTALKIAANDIKTPSGINLFNCESVTDSIFLDSSTGAETFSTAYSASDFIPVSASTRYIIRTFSYTGNPSYRIYRYQSNKTFIARTTSLCDYAGNANGFVFTTDANCAYIRLNFEHGITIDSVQDYKTTVLTKGSYPITEYIPYYTAFDRTARKTEDELTSYGVSPELVSLYGTPESGTASYITFNWTNRNTCQLSGTATADAYSNFIVQSLPSGLLKNGGTYYTLLDDGNSTEQIQNVSYYVFFMKNGNILNRQKIFVRYSCIEIPSDCDQIIIRLQVDSGATVSGTYKVGLFQTPPPDSIRRPKPVTKYVSNSTLNLDSVIADGQYYLDGPQSGAYTITGLPVGAASISSLFNLIVETISYKQTVPYLIRQTIYSRDYPNFKCIRLLKTNGTWTNWTVDSLSMNCTVLPDGTDANDLTDYDKTGVWLVDSGNTYTNLPISVGFLFVIHTTYNTTLQIAIPWTGATIYKRRKLGSNAWETWTTPPSGTTTVTNNYTYPKTTNTYNVTATPTITTDTNNYLASSGDTTDRTNDITTMLSTTGICRLGAGVFYVKDLVMPDNSTIIGSGASTKVYMSGTSGGCAIQLGSYCTVSDMSILGGDATPSMSVTVGDRHGILWQGDYTESHTAPYRSIISNVYIYNFSGGGITCYDTGYGTNNCLEVTNTYIWDCCAGINISYWSEFHKFTNVRCSGCYYGCINNGGNNMFVNCDFSSNKEYAMYMDNSQGQSPNNTHGSCVACVFNHTAHNGTSNSGIGVNILNCANGFIFTGCQIFFSKIHLENTDGITFSSCNFGNSNCNIEISGGGTVTFIGNQHQAKPPITIVNNSNVHFVNNYVRSTGAIVEP